MTIRKNTLYFDYIKLCKQIYLANATIFGIEEVNNKCHTVMFLMLFTSIELCTACIIQVCMVLFALGSKKTKKWKDSLVFDGTVLMTLWMVGQLLDILMWLAYQMASKHITLFSG